jgi:hypothetical protein
VTESGKRWLIGCSAAVFLMVLVLAAIVWGGVVLFKKAAAEIEELEDSSSAVTRQFGQASEFTPDPGEAIPAGRIEAFLAAREIMAPTRDELVSSLATLDGGEGGKIGAGIRLLPRVFGFYEARNNACLEAGIGLGEYRYLYLLSFYNFLEKPVSAGPGFTLTGGSSAGGGPGTRASDFEVREDRREHVLGASRNLALPILRNQLAALEADGGPEGWADHLRQEITNMEADPFRLPWRDGLPDRMAGSLEPYRDRLESSWSELANPLEAGPQ